MENNNNNTNQTNEQVRTIAIIKNPNMKISGMKLRDDLQKKGGKYSGLVKTFLERTDLTIEELMAMCSHISIERDYDQNAKFKVIVTDANNDYPDSKLTPRLNTWPVKITQTMNDTQMPVEVDGKKLRLPWNLIAEALRGEVHDYYLKEILINMKWPNKAGSMLPFYLFKLDKVLIFVCKRIALLERAFNGVRKSAPGVLEDAVKKAINRGKIKGIRGDALTKIIKNGIKDVVALQGEFEDGKRYSLESKTSNPSEFKFNSSIVSDLHNGWLFSMRQIYKCEDMRVTESVTMDTKQKIVSYVIGSIYRMAGEKAPEKLILRKYNKDRKEPLWYVDYFEKFAAVRAIHDSLKRIFAGPKTTGENIYSSEMSGEITGADVDLDLLFAAADLATI